MTSPIFSFRGSVRLLAAVLALVLSASVSATLYKTVGPDGKVTYSDKPPMTAKEAEKTERMRNVPPPGDPDAAKKLTEQQADFQKRALDREASEQKAADERKERAELLRRCQDARTAIRQYKDTGMTLYRAGEKEGERVALDMDTRLKEAARLEEDMKKAGCE
ncbi:MAG: DUF4124 domain-containing protein [Proteobacteria bacterium]|nr:DUF4124 domain-containing protein [Pseudomonadota bacterium]MCL2306827.1 DUF4124 domain-containing protein [Pseudomonadota bacterium]